MFLTPSYYFTCVDTFKNNNDSIERSKRCNQDISHLKFKRTKVKTNDEIGELANSINIMSEKLQEAHQDLTDRNEHLKRFMGDVTHELKTPIALLKAYSMGIKDGLDDGTYVDTIIKQAIKYQT